MNLFGLAISNPALWVGASVLVVPYLIHLLTRRTPRRLVFPTIQFIRQAQANQSALFRMRNLLLLAVRTLFVAALLAAFLKPVYRANAFGGGNNNKGASAHILILDASLSMGYSEPGGLTPFSRAKLAAEKILNQLGAADTANLIVMGAKPTASFPAPAANAFALKRDIENAHPTFERGDIDAAIAEAVRQLALTKEPNKHIHIVTDCQRTNWAAVDFKNIPHGVMTTFLSVAPERAANCAITEIAMRPRAPVVSEAVEIICKVANYGSASQHLPVRLQFGDDPPIEKPTDVAPGSTATVTFRIRAKERGSFEGVVSIPDDLLHADNTRYVTLPVSDRVLVAVVADRPADDRESGVANIVRALDPHYGEQLSRSVADVGQGSLRITPFKPDDFDLHHIGDTHIAVMSDVLPLSQSAAHSLLGFVHDGGALVYFLSSAADVTNLKQFEELSGKAISLPFSAGPPRTYSESPDSASQSGQTGGLTFADANFDDPILRKFRDVRDLASISFFTALTTERAKARGQILIRFSDGSAAFGRATYGAGSVILCNFSVARRGSDFAKSPLFVPFLHEVINGLRPQAGAIRDFTPGYPASGTIPIAASATSVRFTSPSGNAINAQFDRSENDAAVIFAETNVCGFYRVLEKDARLGSVAVNVDPRESDLATISAEQLESLAQAVHQDVTVASVADPGTVQRLMAGTPLWHYFAMAALLGLALEQIFLLLIRR